jgi:Fe-S-cluster containining protein
MTMTDDADHPDDASQWLTAIADAAIMDEIRAVHETIGRAISKHSPACKQSGRCCRFIEFDHRLYTTGLEAAATISELHTLDAQPGLTVEGAKHATESGVCPFQIGKVCSVHAIRPAGCRVFFCDSAWSGVMEETAEQAVAQIRSTHRQYNIPYRYAQWGALLESIARITGPIAPTGNGTTSLTIDKQIDKPQRRT